MCGCSRILTLEKGSNYDNGANSGDKIMEKSERADI